MEINPTAPLPPSIHPKTKQLPLNKIPTTLVGGHSVQPPYKVSFVVKRVVGDADPYGV